MQGYHGELLSWRWESLHDTFQHYVSAREILVKYWERECLSSEAALCDAVTSALSEPFQHAYVEWAFMFSGFVQKWVHWLESCFCDETQLQKARTRKACEAIKCAWKGRRTSALCAGGKERVLQAVRTHSSTCFTEAMLGLPCLVTSAMVLMDNQTREKWSSIVRDKLAYMDHVPRNLAGALAHLAESGRP